MSAPKREHLKLALRATFSLLLVVGLFYYVGSSAIISQMRTVGWGTLAVVVVLLAGHVLIITPRWAHILRALGYPLPMLALIGGVFFGFLFNQLLPTAVGGDVIRAWRARQIGVPWEVAIHSVLLDRASAIVVVVLGTCILLPFADRTPVDGKAAWILGLMTAVGVATIVLGFLTYFAPQMLGAVHRAIVGLERSIGSLVRHPGLLVSIGFLAVLNQLLVLVSIWLLVRALYIEISPLDFAVVIFITSLASTIPISIAGWGVREGALVYLLGAYDVAPDAAIAVSILFGACLTLAAAPAALMLLGGVNRPQVKTFPPMEMPARLSD